MRGTRAPSVLGRVGVVGNCYKSDLEKRPHAGGGARLALLSVMAWVCAPHNCLLALEAK